MLPKIGGWAIAYNQKSFSCCHVDEGNCLVLKKVYTFWLIILLQVYTFFLILNTIYIW